MIARDVLEPGKYYPLLTPKVELINQEPVKIPEAAAEPETVESIPEPPTDRGTVQRVPFGDILQSLIAATPAGERLTGGTVTWRLEAFVLRVERRTEVFGESLRYRLQEQQLDPGPDFRLTADRQGQIRAGRECRCPRNVEAIFQEDRKLRDDFHTLRGLHSLLQLIRKSAEALQQALKQESPCIQPVEGERLFHSFSLRIEWTSIRAEFC